MVGLNLLEGLGSKGLASLAFSLFTLTKVSYLMERPIYRMNPASNHLSELGSETSISSIEP